VAWHTSLAALRSSSRARRIAHCRGSAVGKERERSGARLTCGASASTCTCLAQIRARDAEREKRAPRRRQAAAAFIHLVVVVGVATVRGVHFLVVFRLRIQERGKGGDSGGG